jgi:hypothetical protein
MRANHAINRDASRINSRDDSADNAAATVTVAASTTEYWAVRRIDYSFDVLPTTALTMTISFGGVTKWKIDLELTINPRHIDFFENPIHNAQKVNEAMVVTLSAGGAGKISALNVVYS